MLITRCYHASILKVPKLNSRTFLLIIFLLILWEFHKCILITFRSPPSSLLRSTPSAYLPPLHALYFLRLTESNLCSPNALGYGFVSWNMVNLSTITLLKKTDSPLPSSSQLPIDPQLEPGLCVHLPPPSWDFCLA